jgi:Ca2+-binding EF-hand superfamily protein
VTTAGLAMAMVLAGGAAYADGGAPASREGKFKDWDKNGDGYLQRSEYPGHPGNFRALDADGDGRLSRDEFQHRGGARAPENVAPEDAFEGKDHDRNGKLTRGEWPDTREFDRRDHNGDGVLTRDEYYSPRETTARDDEFRRLDTNNDGYISRAEWKGRGTAFNIHDRNDDGLISRDEFNRTAKNRDVLSKQ